MFKRGLHIIVDLENCSEEVLINADVCRLKMAEWINKHGINVVGEVWHSYENLAFTANIALSDSHISVHTWPEYGKVFFDVYLSSFKADNREKCRELAGEIKQYFQGTVVGEIALER